MTLPEIITLAVITVTSIMIVVALASIADTLKGIRDDLREHFKSEGRRWSIDQERRYEE